MTKPATKSNQTTRPLEQKEMDELNRFLLSDATSDQTMMLDCLDGYLTAIVIGPTLVQASEWLPGVWGLSTRDEPAFETREQAQHILELIMRHIRGIVGSLEHDPDQFKPVFDRVTWEGDTQDYLDGEMWAQGFLRGVKLREQEWKPFLDNPDNATVLQPIRLLGAEKVSAEDEALVATPAQREALTQQIPASVAAMYRYWLPQSKEEAVEQATSTFRRDQPKTGRNDPCPCGSGKKFKKCCGATPTPH